MRIFRQLAEIDRKPGLYEKYTADALWADAHRAAQMLAFHLDDAIDVSSRNLKFIDQSVKWMASELSLGPGSRICDFGCGPGLYTSRFAGLGASVTGIDFSANSIAYARTQAADQGLEIEYIQANYLDVGLPRSFDLITMIMCDFCALNENQRGRLLGIFYAALAEGGRVVLDVYSLSAFEKKEETRSFEKNQLGHFWFEEDYYGFLNVFKYPDSHVTLDKYSLFTESGRTETVYNWLKHYDPGSLQRELAASGFKVKAVYSDVAGGDYDPAHSEFAVVIEKTE